MNRRYGIYYQGILMEEYDTPAEAYKALIERTESTGVFHELKVIEEDKNAQSTIQISPSLC